MHCPFCGAEGTRVKDSRPTDDGASIRRRRLCPTCYSRFTTFERIHMREIIVVKRDGEREAFDRKKIYTSIKIAVNKNRVDAKTLESLTSTITRALLNSGENEISSSHIGELVVEHLRLIDNVGYIRYASVYHNFKGAGDFEDIIRKVQSPQYESRDAAE